MTISKKEEILEVKAELIKRKAKLYHACQLQDFLSYVKLGGIPSRNKLSKSGYNFTFFDTDQIDKEHQLWDKVFGNFSDFGTNYARSSSKSFPNPYGPIQIVLNPSATDNMLDLAISLRSAGSKTFNRATECLKKSDEFKRIFSNTEIKNDATDKFIAFSNVLNERFERTDCTSPEFNTSIKNELIPVADWAYIIVDNCAYKDGLLIDELKKTAPKSVHSRDYQDDRAELIFELSSLTKTYDCNKQSLLSNSRASDNLKALVAEMNEFHYNRFIKYLTIGTTRI
ncbi:hypothetical protein V9L13_22275 [Pseudomonas sp. RSB 5.4]|uniref:hypothetical protein n=1 Tax=Pseudomonas sp. RSB 5.4 TaxID=3127459 RepID=UPI0030D479C3